MAKTKKAELLLQKLKRNNVSVSLVKVSKNDDKSKKKIPKFQCDSCDKEFTKKSSLIRHKNIQHLKIKPYSCGDCEVNSYLLSRM